MQVSNEREPQLDPQYDKCPFDPEKKEKIVIQSCLFRPFLSGETDRPIFC